MEALKSDLEKAEYFQNLLLSFATGNGADDQEYRALRKYFTENDAVERLVPSWIRTNRDIGQFWAFIKGKYAHYAERREFIWSEFRPLLEYLEKRRTEPADDEISAKLKDFSTGGVHLVWKKALERRGSDPEGAITMAKTLLETVCKHILDNRNIAYTSKADLTELYRLTAKDLNLAPNQHTEESFRRILGGVSSVVGELGSLRNRLGDAHGQGKRGIRPAMRHAELAVNLAGSIAVFLVETTNNRSR